jgi:hypothetical protein
MAAVPAQSAEPLAGTPSRSKTASSVIKEMIAMDPRQAYEQKAQAELELLGAGLDELQASAPKGKIGAAISQQNTWPN